MGKNRHFDKDFDEAFLPDCKKGITAKCDPFWCRKRGSNPYDTHVSRDFKSLASANSATPASGVYIISLSWPFCQEETGKIREGADIGNEASPTARKI